MSFVSRIRGKRDVHTLTTTAFNQLVQERRCTPAFTLQEYFPPSGSNCRLTCYYDWDGKFALQPSDAEINVMFDTFKKDLERLHPGEACLYAKRHGWVTAVPKSKDAKVVANVDTPERKYKVSFRAWVRGVFVSRREQIPIHVRTVFGLADGGAHEHIDLTVYKSREQLLAVIGACKDIDLEKRYLVPIDRGGNDIPWEQVRPEEYLAQNPPDDAVILQSSGSEHMAERKRNRGRKPKRELCASGNGTGETNERTLFTSTDTEAVSALTAATDFFGEKYRMHESLSTLTVDRQEKWLLFPTRQKWCWISRKTHASNNPYIIVTEAGARFKCPDEECKAVGEAPHIPLSQLPQSLRDFFTRMFYGHINIELMSSAKEECQKSIVTNFPMEEATEILPYKDMLTTIANHQTCIQCHSGRMQFEHALRGWHLRCNDCGVSWPSHPIPLPESDFPKLFAALTQLNLSIGNITVNNNTVNNTVNNYLTSDENFVGTYENDGLVVFEDAKKNRLFLAALKGTDAPLAQLVFTIFRDEFHCCKTGVKGTEGLWYQFVDHHWVGKAELTLRTRLGSEDAFLKYFRCAVHYYEMECIQTDDTKRKARHIKRVLEQLEDGGRRKRILEDTIELFHGYRPKFAEVLDTANMLVFTNGVFDFTTFAFRDGRPEDYLSISLDFPYRPVEEQPADCALVMEFMSAIQPNECTREYLLTVLSLCLTTDTTLQHFWIFTGGGANGKSKLMNFLMEALGDHFGTAPAALLTRRREDANQANEALNALERARVAVFSEGAASEILQVNTIKLFTGEDCITTRGLHEKQRRWRPRFKCCLICNLIPILDDNSWPAWRRIKVIDFPTLFVDNPRRPHERQKDPEVGEKLSKCVGAFVALLIEYYRRFKARGLPEAPAVTEATQKYQTDNDVFDSFREEHLVEEEGSRLEWDDALPLFRRWAKDNKKNIPDKKADIQKLFVEKLGPIYNTNFKGTYLRGWRHIRLI